MRGLEALCRSYGFVSTRKKGCLKGLGRLSSVGVSQTLTRNGHVSLAAPTGSKENPRKKKTAPSLSARGRRYFRFQTTRTEPVGRMWAETSGSLVAAARSSAAARLAAGVAAARMAALAADLLAARTALVAERLAAGLAARLLAAAIAAARLAASGSSAAGGSAASRSGAANRLAT